MDDVPDARRWCENALRAVFCLWDHKRKQAWRGSQEHAARQKPGATEQFRPTATFNAVMAFGDCGLFQRDVRYGGDTVEIRALQLKVSGVPGPLSADDLLRTFLSTDFWVDVALVSTEHGRKEPGVKLAPRASIMLGRMLPAIHLLARHASLTVLKELQPRLIRGLTAIGKYFTEELFKEPAHLFDETASDKPATVSPQIVMYAAIALEQWLRMIHYLMLRESNLPEEEIEELEAVNLRNSDTPALQFAVFADIPNELEKSVPALAATFRAYFQRQVDRQMARKDVPLDPEYDCASLAFALNGLALLDEHVRSSPFFRKCVAAVVEGQKPDGCWPEGVTVSSHESSDVAPVRQPSVEIALSLAEMAD